MYSLEAIIAILGCLTVWVAMSVYVRLLNRLMKPLELEDDE